MKKILFISPIPKLGTKTHDALRIPQVSLYYLAALTPVDKYEMKFVEEEIHDLNMDEECDIVGISIMTANAKRGYKLADEFRKRGKKVVIGGVHATAMPDEAKSHADSVCIGEAEPVWKTMLEDIENDSMKPFYKGEYPDLSDPILSPQPRLDLSPKGFMDVKPLVCTRGCPYSCSFCCVHKFYGRKLRHVPPKTIAQTMESYKNKYWMFLDDNVIGNPSYAKELFNTIIPLKKKWLSQASISFINDIELMKLAAKSGCAGLFFGLENVTVKDRKKFTKNSKSIEQIEESIKIIRDLGIVFHASLVFGFDDDTEETFIETLDFLMRNKVPSVSFNVLTPYPGTEVYEQFKRENRILTDDWTNFDHCTVVYQPKVFSPVELMDMYFKLRKDFYTFPSILKRFYHSPHPILTLAMNISYHYSTKSQNNNMTNLSFLTDALRIPQLSQ